MLKIRHKAGFTLIEALVTITLVGVIGFLLADLLQRTFRGNTKTALLGAIKQNGQSALNLMDTSLRYSASVTCYANSPSESVITTIDRRGTYTRFVMRYETNVANGYIVQDNPVPTNQEEIDQLCDTWVPSDNQKIITDQDPNSGVSLRFGFFNVNDQSERPVIIIHLELAPPINANLNFENQIGQGGTVPFQTTVVLR